MRYVFALLLAVPFVFGTLTSPSTALAQNPEKITEGMLVAAGESGNRLGPCPLVHTAVRAQIADGLAGAALEVVAGRANFLLLRVGDAPAFRLALLRRGFAVRDCTSFGLPEWVRVAVPSEGAVRRLLNAWRAAYEETRGALA